MALLSAAFVLLLSQIQPALCQQYQLIQEYTPANIFDEFDFYTVDDARASLISKR